MNTEFNFTSVRSKRLYKKFCKSYQAKYKAEEALIKSQRKDCESKKAKDIAKTYEGKWYTGGSYNTIIYAHKAKFVSYGTENIALCIEGWNFIKPDNVQYNSMYFVDPMQDGLGAEIPTSKIAAVLKKKGYDLDMFKMFIKLCESK